MSEEKYYVESWDRITKRWFRYADSMDFWKASNVCRKLSEAGWKCRIVKAK